MSTTDPTTTNHATDWPSVLVPSSLRDEAQEILTGIDEARATLLDYLIRAQEFDARVEHYATAAREQAEQVMAELSPWERYALPGADDAGDAAANLARDMSGDFMIRAALDNLSAFVHPDTVYGWRAGEVVERHQQEKQEREQEGTDR